MFRFDHALRRRISVHRHDGVLAISINRNNHWLGNVYLTIFFTFVFLIFSFVFLRGFLRIRSPIDGLFLLPFVLFVAVWYWMALRLGLWRSFGVEQLVIEGGQLT
jgi:hypothetical protein